MHVALVGYIEDELVGRGVEDLVKGHREFDYSEVGAEVAAIERSDRNKAPTNLFSQLSEFFVGEVFDIRWLGNLAEQRVFVVGNWFVWAGLQGRSWSKRVNSIDETSLVHIFDAYTAYLSGSKFSKAVSYTHLTLPTNREV